MDNSPKPWDVFISHASEDKDGLVRPLAVALQILGVTVWYDEFSLRIGDSLSRSIDQGLSGSNFAVVVISPHFLAKPWPEYELRGLVAREIGEDRVILPIWHHVTRGEVLRFSPPLADKIALKTEDQTAQDLAIKLLREIRPDLYHNHSREELERLVTGTAVQELQAELESVREELSEYQCPYCGSPLTSRNSAPTDPEEKDWDTIESFECGFSRFGSIIKQPCPSDPRFPKFEDYELQFRKRSEERYAKWQCQALGKTDMALRLNLGIGFGQTREEALQQVRAEYQRVSGKARA